MIRLFGVTIAGSVLLLVVCDILILGLCYFAGSYLALAGDLTELEFYLMDDNGILRIAIVVVMVQLGLYAHDLYEDFRPRFHLLLTQQVSVSLGVTFLVQALITYSRLPIQLSRWTMVFGSILVLIVFPAWRRVYDRIVLASLPAKRLLFIGSSPAMQEIVGRIDARPELGFRVVGYLDGAASSELQKTEVAWLGTPDEVTSVVRAVQPDKIVIGMSERRNQLPVLPLLDLRFSGVAIEDASTTYETIFGRVSTRELRPSDLIFFEGLGPNPLSVPIQNIYSILIALIGTIITLPIMLAVALVVKLTSPGPVLFRQKRVGKNGSIFTILKFRSMRADAEKGTGAVWAVKNDPRITPVGKWLRKLRLDELPQLLNVLRGEMSIVGPRPERPEFVEPLNQKIPFYSQRHCVKPGITGWAQINHKYGDTLEDTVIKLEYDLYYIKNLTPALDAFIIFHTLKVMLLSRGAQ
jgi:sugar transferase (PEP-CTERM system associated)